MVEKYTNTVSTVSDKEIQLTHKSEASGTTVNITETADLNGISGFSASGSSMQWSPDTGTYTFPLETGKTWEVKTDFVRADGYSGSYTLTAKVIGWEKVKVPAGEFAALKITENGCYGATKIGGKSGTGSMQRTIWYTPAVGNTVKSYYEDTNWRGGPRNKITKELIGYNKVN